MAQPIGISDEFASAMQQLAAEAKKLLPANDCDASRQLDEQPAGFAPVLEEFRALNARLDALEQKITAPANHPQLEQLSKHVEAIRETESVNQRLFDSLHQELIGYRDNFLHESLQKPFIRDLIVLYDDLTAIASQLQAAGSVRSVGGQPLENLEHAVSSLVEILHRLEVTEIEQREHVDRNLHRVVSIEPADFDQDDGRIVLRVKRGFMWRERVLRPEEVIAKRWG